MYNKINLIMACLNYLLFYNKNLHTKRRLPPRNITWILYKGCFTRDNCITIAYNNHWSITFISFNSYSCNKWVEVSRLKFFHKSPRWIAKKIKWEKVLASGEIERIGIYHIYFLSCYYCRLCTRLLFLKYSSKWLKKVLCETVDWRQIPHKYLLLLTTRGKRKGAVVHLRKKL